MPDIILHHYYEQASPFSERVRLVLGLKGLSWGSVLTGYVPPRPHLDILTGGYRRIPVMQIGADVYCDTRCIIEELERRYPDPTVYPNGERGLSAMLTSWSHGPMLTHAFCLYVGRDSDRIPDDYIQDRIEITEGALDVERLKAAVPVLWAQVRAQLDWIESQLGDGRDFLLGTTAGLADITAYQNAWFLEEVYSEWSDLVAPFPRLRRWMERIKAIGHGEEIEMDPTAALAAARDSDPETAAGADSDAPIGARPGDRVQVMPDDYAKVPVKGELVESSAQHVAIRRTDPQVGEVVAHFPQMGFVVLPDA
jgi:glutathione S-transferase